MEYISEAFFMALGAVLFVTALSLLLWYHSCFEDAYEQLYQRTLNETVMFAE